MGPEIAFTCNICDGRGIFREPHYINPELPSCSCGSNVRFRWLVYRLSRELFGQSLCLREFPSDKSIKGIGLTDPESIARVLTCRFEYRNTYFNAEPRLDLRSDPSPIGELDFLIASEVFEHIEPPVTQPFRNASGFLKPNGFLLLTVPWVWNGDPKEAIPELYDWKLDREGDRWLVINRKPDGEIERFYDMVFDDGPGRSLGNTREHFPELHDWKLVNEDENWRLINRRRDGRIETFHNLVFHEGPGLALEMRLFAKRSLEDNLREAGFGHIEFEMQGNAGNGIIFPYPWSRPVVARRYARSLAGPIPNGRVTVD
jgi:hypothetical protein